MTMQGTDAIRALARSDASSYSLRQLGLLLEIADNGGSIDFGDAARRLRAPKSAVTRCCDKLEAEGIIKRRVQADDRRRVDVTLTDDGVRFVRDQIVGVV